MAAVADADRSQASTRYREVCPLTTGGMAELHLARMSGVGGFERLVVIKRLMAKHAGSPDLVQQLLDEARIAARLQHGNIVQVHDVAIEHGSVSIVMEYLHGQDVRTLMRRLGGKLPLDQAIAIVLGACAGLHHAHEQVDADGKPLDIVHRDVSADNVFVTYDGGIKLIDFGIARARSRMGHTEHGIIKGKPGYMAPEQIRCEPIDRRADIHATAVLLYEMTVGRRPRDVDDHAQFAATVDRDAIPPRHVIASYPEALEAIAMRGLERQPERRFATALEMQKALDQFARERKLDLSSFGLAKLMERVFPDKLEAWQTAQRSGKSLADHVAALRQSTLHAANVEDVRAAVNAEQAAKTSTGEMPHRGGPRMAHVLLAVGVLGVAAALLGWWQSRTPAASATTDPVAPPTMETKTTPTPTPTPPTPEPVPVEPVPVPTAVDNPEPTPEPVTVDDPPVRRAKRIGKLPTRRGDRDNAAKPDTGEIDRDSAVPRPDRGVIKKRVDPDAPLPR
jgi:serine/threonine protein kinase